LRHAGRAVLAGVWPPLFLLAIGKKSWYVQIDVQDGHGLKEAIHAA
jgi:hypothetical protein